jgi:DNA polymerase III sliding clamp (beta) subunit (PCNA family)
MSKIALPIAELKPALIGLGKVIAKYVTLPVLNHVKIERTKDGWTALTSTDLDHHVTVRLEQPSDGDALSLLVPYDELLKITKNCQKTDTLLLSGGSKAVTIEYAIGNQVAEVKLDSLPVEEFPHFPRIKGEPVPVPDAVRSSIHEAMECASTDETRLIINGAFIDVSKPNAHYIVGTDGSHLFASNSFSLGMKDSLIIPTHKFIGWKEFSHDGEWQVKIAPPEKKDEPGHFQISSRRWRFISRQLEGNYPNWRQVIPTEFNTSAEFDPQTVNAMIQTIQRMPDHDPINHSLGIELKRKKANLLCKASKDQPWMPVEIEHTEFKGPEVTIHLNRHLLVKALEFGLLRLDIIDSLSPLRFSHEGRQIIVSPLRADSSSSKPAPAQPPVSEPNGNGEAEPVKPHQPAANAAQPERTSMPRASTTTASNGNGNATPSNGNGDHAEKTSIESAVDQIETVKGSLRSAKDGLNQLLDTLKQVQRDHKTSEREVQSVRTTLEKLQSVKL